MRKGFTLLEILVVVVIFFIIIGAIFGVMVSGRKTFDVGSVQIEVAQEARRGLDYMSRELRQSRIISTGTGTVTFQIPVNADGSGNITWGDGQTSGNQIGYSVGNFNKPNQLIRELLDGVGAPLSPRVRTVSANDIGSLQFDLSGNIVAISLRAEKYVFKGFTSTGDEQVTIDLNTQVRLRNN